jgi:hypothetical protein
MTKDFIPYEESLELKELGYYDTAFGQWWEDKDDSEKFLFTNNDMSEEHDLPDIRYVCDAPLYQQSFRFFRNKYGYYPFIEFNERFKKWLSRYCNIDGSIRAISVHDTYEEAELECLKNLIQIVKQQQ